MRVLVVRPWGKTAFELAGYCRQALEEIGHSAEVFLYNDERMSSRLPFLGSAERFYIRRSLFRKVSIFKPHFVLVIKGDRIPLDVIRELKQKFKIPVANYWIDDPHSIAISRKVSPAYDFFFTNDPACVKIHRESGCPHVRFMSFGCVPQLHRKIDLKPEEKKYYGSDICFAGTVSEGRMKVLEALEAFDIKIWSLRVVQSFGKNYHIDKKELTASSLLYARFTGQALWNEELVKAYNASKIILNVHSPQPVPIMRDFEVTGCGGFLLTDRARNMDTLFKPGKEIVLYSSIEELKDLVEFYLSHPEEREKIARKGQKRAYQDHTYARRLEEMISFIKEHT